MGFQFQERNGKLTATVVWEGTEASACGLKAGNQIIQMGNFLPQKVATCEWTAFTEKEVQAQVLVIKYLDEQGATHVCRLNKLNH